MPFSAWSLLQIFFGGSLASLGFFAFHRYRKYRRLRIENDLAQTLRDIQRRQQQPRPQAVSRVASTTPVAYRKDRGSKFPPFEGIELSEQSAPAEVAPTLISVPALDSQTVDDTEEVNFNLGKRWSVVSNLAEEGHDLESISKATGLLIGEVELILGLMRSIQNAAASGMKPPKDSHS